MEDQQIIEQGLFPIDVNTYICIDKSVRVPSRVLLFIYEHKSKLSNVNVTERSHIP